MKNIKGKPLFIFYSMLSVGHFASISFIEFEAQEINIDFFWTFSLASQSGMAYKNVVSDLPRLASEFI
ncbi:MAG: hypothetical protein ABIP35_16420 [Ginsengibacter sp.]